MWHRINLFCLHDSCVEQILPVDDSVAVSQFAAFRSKLTECLTLPPSLSFSACLTGPPIQSFAPFSAANVVAPLPSDPPSIENSVRGSVRLELSASTVRDDFQLASVAPDLSVKGRDSFDSLSVVESAPSLNSPPSTSSLSVSSLASLSLPHARLTPRHSESEAEMSLSSAPSSGRSTSQNRITWSPALQPLAIPSTSVSPSSSSTSPLGLGVTARSSKMDWVDFSVIGPDMAYAVFEYVGPVTLLECVGVCRAWYWRLAPNQSNFFHGWLQSITGMCLSLCGSWVRVGHALGEGELGESIFFFSQTSKVRLCLGVRLAQVWTFPRRAFPLAWLSCPNPLFPQLPPCLPHRLLLAHHVQPVSLKSVVVHPPSTATSITVAALCRRHHCPLPLCRPWCHGIGFSTLEVVRPLVAR